jgi:hypothetical protein
MADRPWQIAALVLVILAIIFVGIWWSLLTSEPEPDPFYMTLVVSSVDTNVTDGNLSDVVVWVAVAGGEPHPRWSGVEVLVGPAGGGVALTPPQLEVDDQDGNGRISQGDLIRIRSLEASQLGGEVSLVTDGRTIGKVDL